LVLTTITCPGCGLSSTNHHLEAPSGYNATGECYQKYNELSLYTLSKQDLNFIHQHAVDTYSAQHAGTRMKEITIVFSLIGLYYAIEHGYTGKQVQRVHILLSKQKHKWPSLQLPSKSYTLTVHDVLKEELGENRDTMLQKWMRDVWQCWDHHHNWIRDISKILLK
jgi:hypothetical protein